MTPRHKKQVSIPSRRGFTVLEVMVASSILVMSILATVSAFSYARRTVSRTENHLACLHIAREVMETLRGEPYTSDLLKLGTNKRLPTYPFAQEIKDQGYHPFERGHYDVTLSDNAEAGDAKDITVVINWAEPADGMKIRSVSLTTSHSRGLHQ